MNTQQWRPFGDSRPAELGKARLQAHHAVQWLARAARAFIPPRPDDSHTNLGWDDSLGGFTTHALKGGARLGFRISDLTLLVLAGAPNSFPLDGRTDSDARKWLDEELNKRGLEANALDAPSPYEMPTDPIARGASYAVVAQKNELAAFAAWFGNANASLVEVKRQIEARKLAASPVRCWPHHFDLATLTSLDKSGAEHGRSVNAGFSPGDHYYEEPYFYVSPYPYPEPAALAPLPALGHWHTHDFTAAIAPASRIIAAKNPQTDVDAFLRAAVETCLKALN